MCGLEGPEKLTNVHPVIPAEARGQQFRDRVELDVTVGVDGRVRDAMVIKSIGSIEGIDEAVVDAVLQWTYQPAVMAGRPVAVRLPVVVSIVLH